MDLIKKADHLYIPENFDTNHVYYADAEGTKKYTGVTTILGVLNKPALVGWAARMAVEYLKERGELAGGDGKESGLYYIGLDDLEEAKTAYAKKRDEGAQKGTDIHADIEDYVRYSIATNNGKPSPVTQGYKHTEIFATWAIKENITFISAETPLVSEKLWVAGTADLIFEKDGKRYVGDIKTYKKLWDRTPMYQCAGYALMYEEMYGHKAHLKQLTETDDPLNYQGHEAQKISGYCIINLPKERKFNEKDDIRWSFDVAGDTKAFLACVELYKQNKNWK